MFYSYYTHEKLKNSHKYLDRDKNLLYLPVSTDHPIPKKIYAHHICESFEYAHYILDADKEKNKELAENIINEALKYQITEKNSSFFGEWIFFAEDISKNIIPNADNDSKTGMILIQLLKNYNDFLSENLVRKMEKSCFITVFALMSSHNTLNPLTIMNMSYTSALCGEMYGKPEFVKFAEQLMQNLYNSLMYYNSLYEYLDTTNSIYIIEITALMMKNVKNKICRNVCSTVNNTIWEEYSLHYHHKTKQISGPFSYTHSDFLSDSFNRFLPGTIRKNFLQSPDDSGNYTECPAKFLPYFHGEKSIEFQQKQVCDGITSPHYRASTVVSSYIRPDYTLGSANREFFWERRRPFIGFFGDEENKYCYKIDVLHDFYSYSSAVLHSVQMRGYAMGHITFLTNRGDRHINIDSPAPSITAEDFRIRFSITGNTEHLKISHSKNALEVKHGNVTLTYKIPFADIDGSCPKCRFSEDDNKIYFDAIIHSGKKKVIDFTKMETAVLEFIFLITSTGKKINIPEHTVSDGFLNSNLTLKKNNLTLRTPVKPGYDSVCLTIDKQLVNGTVLEEYVTRINENMKNYMFIEKTNQQQPVDFPISMFDKSESGLYKKIDSLQFQNLGTIHAVLMEILDTMSSSEYSITLRKRLAIQIAINIFECAKNIDYRLREIIDRKYSDIFRKITASESFEEIHQHIMDMYNLINTGNSALKGTGTPVISSVFTLIDENLLNPNLSLEFIADTLGYSTSYLSRLFTKTTGSKYVTYIHEKKIRYAMDRLKENKKSLKEISDEIGYSHPNSFMRIFKKHTGMTISEYLKTEFPN